MAFQQVPETVEICVHYTLSGRALINTYHARQSGGYNQAGIDALAIAIDGGPVQSLLADQSATLRYQRTTVRGLASINDITTEVVTGPTSGGQGHQSMPNNVAFAVSRLSGLTGRNARGRVYVGGIPENAWDVTNDDVGSILAAFADAYRGHVDGFRAAIDAVGTFDPVIVSRWLEGAKRATAVTFPWISTQYNDRKLDTRRSRIG